MGAAWDRRLRRIKEIAEAIGEQARRAQEQQAHEQPAHEQAERKDEEKEQ